MDSILRVTFRQTKTLLRLSRTVVHAVQLQRLLAADSLPLFERNATDHCAFSHDLCNELRSVQKQLNSTCFFLQQALYRLQAWRQRRADRFIRVDEKLFVDYEEWISPALINIQRTIAAIVERHQLTDSPLNALRGLFEHIQQNFVIFLDFVQATPRMRSTLHLGGLVSDTLERFYFILGALARLVSDIEQFEFE